MKKSLGLRTLVNSCLPVNASLFDSVSVDRASHVTILIMTLHDALYTYLNNHSLPWEGREETSLSQVLTRNETIYSNKMKAVVFFLFPVVCSA